MLYLYLLFVHAKQSNNFPALPHWTSSTYQDISLNLALHYGCMNWRDIYSLYDLFIRDNPLMALLFQIYAYFRLIMCVCVLCNLSYSTVDDVVHISKRCFLTCKRRICCAHCYQKHQTQKRCVLSADTQDRAEHHHQTRRGDKTCHGLEGRTFKAF